MFPFFDWILFSTKNTDILKAFSRWFRFILKTFTAKYTNTITSSFDPTLTLFMFMFKFLCFVFCFYFRFYTILCIYTCAKYTPKLMCNIC